VGERDTKPQGKLRARVWKGKSGGAGEHRGHTKRNKEDQVNSPLECQKRKISSFSGGSVKSVVGSGKNNGHSVPSLGFGKGLETEKVVGGGRLKK